MGLGGWLDKRAEEKREREWQEFKNSSYPVTIKCGNCGFEREARVTKGYTVAKWAEVVPCDNCRVKGTFR